MLELNNPVVELSSADKIYNLALNASKKIIPYNKIDKFIFISVGKNTKRSIETTYKINSNLIPKDIKL